jgi:tetratricopeptide (TPR) repeat protein
MRSPSIVPARWSFLLLPLAALAGEPAAPSGAAAAAGASAPTVVPAAAPADLASLLSEADAAYAHRDEQGRLDELKDRLQGAEKLAPADYGVLWRISRLYFWICDDPALGDEERARLGKIGWEYGDKATAANPGGVEGWFYASSGVGYYSLGMGVVKALLQGMEGKYRDRLARAEQIDPSFSAGGIEDSWGRFYYELPWPKYDGGESERHLLNAIRINPNDLRARLYLAELYVKEDHPKEARAMLQKVLARTVGAYDAPEERRIQERARVVLSQLK